MAGLLVPRGFVVPEVLECVYIFPSRSSDFEIDPVLFKTVKDWVASKRPFKKVRYPGRE